MNLHRRAFLKTSFAGAGMVSWGLSVPAFLSRTAQAAQPSKKPGTKDTILVVIQLTGGNDGLNTVIPYADAEYSKLRPTLAQPRSTIKRIDDHIGLHPSMDGMAKLLQEQALCIVQGVGYPNPSQSHFRSMDIWHAGGLGESPAEGWIGKALKTLPAPTFHLAQNKESAPLALSGAPARVPSLTSLDDFQLHTSAASGKDKTEQRSLIEAVARPEGGQADLLDFVKRTAVNTYASSRRLQEIGKNYQPKAVYPNTGLAGRLKLAAQLINADLGARIFYVEMDGFDTHANQAAGHANLLRELSDAVTAFYRDMAARGNKDRILVMTFSEFGRRAGENGSKGTDHGSAAPMLLVGGKVKPGLVGAHPSLTQLEMGNLKHHTDFRQVYAAILENWLGVPSAPVVGSGFKPVEVVRA
jgi:uncharacterized protein (DUF1501 family)